MQTAWRLLDYLAVDYPRRGRRTGGSISPSEYAEMREFSASVSQRIAALPAKPAARRPGRRGARRSRRRSARKAPPAEVERLAHGLAGRLLAAYPVPLAPQPVPDLGPRRPALRRALRRPATAPPAWPTRRRRARSIRVRSPSPTATAPAERSLFGLYQVIGQGLEGTAMQSFASLPDADRWALAFHVGRFAYPDALAEAGARLWQGDAGAARPHPQSRDAWPG